jgi:hypothetical protein
VPSAPDPSPGQPASGGPADGMRPRIERASTPALRRLAALPALVPFLVVGALMLTGAFLGGVVGGLLLAVPITFLSWLLYLTWPHLRRPERMMRVSVLLLVVAIAVTSVTPR